MTQDKLTAIDAEFVQEEPIESELDMLKDQARLMGITFSPNIGVSKLREKIQAHRDSIDNKVVAGNKTAREEYIERLQATRKEALKLRRIKISCLNPAKANVPGEYITVGNDLIGTVCRWVPYSGAASESWHVEQIIYDILKSRRYLNLAPKKSSRDNRNMLPEQHWVPEFSIEDLPQLTEEELKQLAADQSARGAID